MALLRFISNVLWFIGGGLISFFTWLFLGLGLCITLIGIPFGLQCLKMATLVLAPFGKEVVYGGKTGSFLMNILWLPFGLVLCLEQVAFGLIYCITIIGIPAGLQAFKMAKLALMPFGAEVRKKGAKVKAKPAKADPKQATAEATSTTAPTTASTAPAPTEPTPAQQPQSTTNTTMAATAQPAPSVQVAIDNPAPSNQPPQPVTDTPIPTTEPAPAPQTPPSPAEPTSTEPNPESTEEPKNNRALIITIIVVAIIVIILGVAAFLIFPFFMGNRMREPDIPKFEPIASQEESTSQSTAPAPALVDIKIACQNDFGGEFITFGISYINDAIMTESYYCDVAGDPSQSFSVFIASDDYLTIVADEAALYGEIVDSDNFSTEFSHYLDQWLDAGILTRSNASYPLANYVRDNIAISLYSYGNEGLADAVANLLYPPAAN